MNATTTQQDMQPGEFNTDALGVLDDLLDREVTRADVSTVAALARSEIETQLDAAHKYPRSIGRFLKEAKALATLTREVAESCIYTLPRSGKAITGPSVRLAEIAASAYGNLHISTRVIDAEAKDKTICAQGLAWDLEKNNRLTSDVLRRITDRNGHRYNDDMIVVTGNAAASIAFRNTVFRVIPRAYITEIYNAARLVAVGTAATLAKRREDALAHFGKMGVLKEQVLARIERASVEDITLEDLEVLIGISTAIRDHGGGIDEHFPSAKTPGPGGVKTNGGTSALIQAADPKALEEKLRANSRGRPAQASAKSGSDDALFGKAAPAKGDAADSPPPDDYPGGDANKGA